MYFNISYYNTFSERDMEQKINGKIENYYYSKAINRHYTESTIHYHPHYEIYYLKEGRCKYFVDDRTYDMETGDIVFIPKGAIHRANYPEGGHSRLLINCTESYIPDYLIARLESSPLLYHSHEISKHAETILSQIEHEYNHPDEFTIESLKCHTIQLLFLMLRYPGDSEESGTGNALIDDIVKYIGENFTSDIKLSTVAKLKSVSPEHLSRTFKACIGNGFNEYVTLLRLRHAEDMIKNNPEKTISEIAYECGFNDGNYFSYKFKKMYGISPIKARESK
jgi:AraC-like DNA-binding protein